MSKEMEKIGLGVNLDQVMKTMTAQWGDTISYVMDEAAKADKKKDHFAHSEVKVKHTGTQIILPGEPTPMRYDEAIECLKRKQEDEETTISVNEIVNAFPFDGAFAFMEAMKQTYGWASPQAQETFFGPIPPKTIAVETDYQVFTQIIWGKFKVSGLVGHLTTGMTMHKGKPCFVIGGEVKKKNQLEIGVLADLTRKIVQTQSIYKGKAIALKTDDDGDVDWATPPSFLDLTKVNSDELTFSDDVSAQVQTNLFTPIEYTTACRENKIPLKRGVLLEGPFGTGKTLTAFVTAQKARDNGWTFVLIDRVGGLDDALDFARTYQPAVVFAEDVDRAVSGDDRTVEIDDILNTIDGIESKGTEVITILTSNDVRGINRAMLRPGRLDAIISVQAPDAKAAEKLIRIYARGLIGEKTDLSDAGIELHGQIPATIREAVERSKLYAISRAKGGKIKLTGDDIVLAARGMKAHLDLLNTKKEKTPSPEKSLGLAFAALVEKSVSKKSELSSQMNQLTSGVFATHEHASMTRKKVNQIADTMGAN